MTERPTKTLMVSCSDEGEVSIGIPDLGRIGMTWMDAVDLAYSVRAAALVAASNIGVEEPVWERVTSACEAAVRESLLESTGDDEEA